MEKLQCIVCRDLLDNIYTPGIQPNAGLAFYSQGHYGTTFFDPMDGSYIEVCICDSCLEKADKQGLIYRKQVAA